MIKLFEEFNNEQEIRDICKKYKITNYVINNDGSIDVDGNVNLNGYNLTRFPIIFNKVNGDFSCRDNKLSKLEGSPKEVGNSFDCSNNNLKSLINSPKEVGNSFRCSNNHLTSLEYSPERVGNIFNCSFNKLTSLIGSPMEIGLHFYCTNNQLVSLEGGPIIIGGDFLLENNPISIIDTSTEVKDDINIGYTNFDDKIKSLSQKKLRILFEHGVDYNIFDKDGNVNDSRLDRMFKDFNI